MTTEMDRQHVIELVSAKRTKGEYPNLIGENLRHADLHGTDLSYVDLSYSDLFDANLYDANLYDANLYDANLVHADLTDANLSHANLAGGNLRGADLSYADLSHANLGHADLSYADLSHANLTGASLVGANMHNTQAGDILQITGLHPRQIIVTPERDGWNINIGCWNGTPAELRTLIAQDTGWPEAEGDEILHRRPLLEAALTMIEAHMAAHPSALDAARQAHARWEKHKEDNNA
ncbi:pentapeptide repeat-containing protein [Corynebacterium ulceribovis]|uniref:pentapeptide repeat-containing protein n=1 Tax=Corynebacterium ulceribovis TaxID=487732 RepID=UPI0003693645|nr:pentapeptide repeat-containing protein [Corynebacterium ulceribovis]